MSTDTFLSGWSEPNPVVGDKIRAPYSMKHISTGGKMSNGGRGDFAGGTSLHHSRLSGLESIPTQEEIRDDPDN